MNSRTLDMFRSLLTVGALLLAGAGFSPAWALTAGQSYSVVLSKINNDGTATAVSSTSAVADANGKIQFSLSNLPTTDSANFVLLEVKDANGTLVRQGIAPAPAPNDTNLVGINTLSNVQAKALLKTMQDNQTDDPMGAAFGLIFVRSPSMQDADISIMSQMMAVAILGGNGMEAFLLANGVSTAQLATFKQRLINNPDSGALDLVDYVKSFKDAVDNDNPDDLTKAGGLMGDIFMDAATSAGIDSTLILAAFDAAGSASGNGTTVQNLMLSVSPGFANSINQAVTSFFTRIAVVKLKKDYGDALTTLGGEQVLIDRFNTAITNFAAAQQAIDIQFAPLYDNPEQFTAAQRQQMQTDMDNAFNGAFNTLQSDIRSTDAEIADMISRVATATGDTVANLTAQNVGKDYDFNGNLANWPIPQTLAVRWVADQLIAGGSLSYSRDTTPVPTSMGWLDSDDDPSNGIDRQRHDFTVGIPPSFAALLGLIEDMQIIENTRYSDSGGGADPAQEVQARVNFLARLDALAARIGGTTDGTTAIGAGAKRALLRLLQQLSLH